MKIQPCMYNQLTRRTSCTSQAASSTSSVSSPSLEPPSTACLPPPQNKWASFAAHPGRLPYRVPHRSACETAGVASVTWRSAGLPAAPLLSVCCWLTAHQSRCATHRSAAHGGCSEDRRHRVCSHVPSTQTGGYARDLGASVAPVCTWWVPVIGPDAHA